MITGVRPAGLDRAGHLRTGPVGQAEVHQDDVDRLAQAVPRLGGGAGGADDRDPRFGRQESAERLGQERWSSTRSTRIGFVGWASIARWSPSGSIGPDSPLVGRAYRVMARLAPPHGPWRPAGASAVRQARVGEPRPRTGRSGPDDRPRADRDRRVRAHRRIDRSCAGSTGSRREPRWTDRPGRLEPDARERPGGARRWRHRRARRRSVRPSTGPTRRPGRAAARVPRPARGARRPARRCACGRRDDHRRREHESRRHRAGRRGGLRFVGGHPMAGRERPATPRPGPTCSSTGPGSSSGRQCRAVRRGSGRAPRRGDRGAPDPAGSGRPRRAGRGDQPPAARRVGGARRGGDRCGPTGRLPPGRWPPAAGAT